VSTGLGANLEKSRGEKQQGYDSISGELRPHAKTILEVITQVYEREVVKWKVIGRFTGS
jgi:hypothetical protein